MFFSISRACVPESQWVHAPVCTTAVCYSDRGSLWSGSAGRYHQPISVYSEGLQAHFRRHGIELDWVLYSDYDALVEAFVRREIDLAWNAPLAYVKIKRRLQDPCQVVAMRDVDVNFTTHFITHAGSGITTVQDLKGVVTVLFPTTAGAQCGT